MKESKTGARQQPLIVRGFVYIFGMLVLAAPIFLMMGVSANLLEPNLYTRIVYAVAALGYAVGLTVLIRRNHRAQSELRTKLDVECAGRDRVRRFMTGRIANTDNAQCAERWQVIDAFHDGKAIDALTILWSQLVEAERQRWQYERLLGTLTGHFHPRHGLSENEAFKHKLAHYEGRVKSWMDTYTQARHMTDPPTGRNGNTHFSSADPETFSRVLDLLGRLDCMLHTASDALGVRRPTLRDTVETFDLFRERLRDAAERCNNRHMWDLERKISHLQHESAALVLLMACRLFAMRPEGKFDEMTDRELRHELLGVVQTLKRSRKECAQEFVRALRTDGVSLESVLELIATEHGGGDRLDEKTLRAALGDVIQDALKNGQLIAEEGEDHPQARELISFFVARQKSPEDEEAA
jgi:hypothetical protein